MPEPIRLWLDFYGGSKMPLDPTRLYVGNVAGPVFATSLLAVVLGAAWLWYCRLSSLPMLAGSVIAAPTVTTWDGSTLVGFAVAGPAWGDGRASLLNVLIDPAFRGRGLVWPLIDAVERELLARGIRELDIDARVENSFADNVERRYGARATVIEPDHPSPYGPQRTIRVTLAARRGRPVPRAKR